LNSADIDGLNLQLKDTVSEVNSLQSDRKDLMRQLQSRDEKILELKQKVVEEKETYSSLKMNFQKQIISIEKENETDSEDNSSDYDDEVDKKDKIIK